MLQQVGSVSLARLQPAAAVSLSCLADVVQRSGYALDAMSAGPAQHNPTPNSDSSLVPVPAGVAASASPAVPHSHQQRASQAGGLHNHLLGGTLTHSFAAKHHTRHPASSSSSSISRGFSTAAQPAERTPGSASSSISSFNSNLFSGLYDDEALARMTPQAVVDKLDKFIIGQGSAKKAVAIAFRNRWRRHRVPPAIRDDIIPKNILMIGPTGCGKTEIARRLAKLADAPFIKVEATKFTEVGYHGRDVDTIIKDLLENAILLVKQKLRERAATILAHKVEERLIKLLRQAAAAAASASAAAGPPGPGADAGASAGAVATAALAAMTDAELLERLRNKELEGVVVEVEAAQPKPSGDMSHQPSLQMVISMFPQPGKRPEKRKVTVAQARPQLEDSTIEAEFPQEVIVKEAIRLTEQDGIVFIDEIDKIVNSKERSYRSGDPSSEGVQRDLLPIIEGSTVNTKHGNVNTDHILFVCSGAFTSCKPSDLMAELQGRLPIRVELQALTQQDFVRILTEPEFNLIRQQQVLLAQEGVELQFTDAAIQAMARIAEEVNRSVENIGARRLHTVVERVVEDTSFKASDLHAQALADGKQQYLCVIDEEQVTAKLGDLLKRQDLSKYII